MTEKAPKVELTLEEMADAELLKRQQRETNKRERAIALTSAEERAIIAALRQLVPARPEVPAATLPPERKIGRVVLEGLATIGDVHFGETVDEVSMGGMTSYSSEIARERFDYTIDEMIARGQEVGLQSFTLALMGDMISGSIHEDLTRHNEFMTIQQTLECAEMVYGGIEKLAQAFPEVYVLGVSGNHARMEHIPYYKKKQVENLDYMLYKILEMKGANQENVHFDTKDQFWNIFEVGERKFLAMHGDTIKFQNSMSLPWYSMWKEYMKWAALKEEVGDFDDMLIGHYHQGVKVAIGSGRLICNYSLKGMDEYSLAGTRLPCPAGSRLLIVGGGQIVSDHEILIDGS